MIDPEPQPSMKPSTISVAIEIASSTRVGRSVVIRDPINKDTRDVGICKDMKIASGSIRIIVCPPCVRTCLVVRVKIGGCKSGACSYTFALIKCGRNAKMV